MITQSTAPEVEIEQSPAEQAPVEPFPADVHTRQPRIAHPEVANDTLVSAEYYMEHFAANYYEWVNGRLIKISPVTKIHHNLTAYLYVLLETYVSLKDIGEVLIAPFVLRLDESGSYREPDLQVVLNDNPGVMTDTAMIGAANICIEIVSPESVKRDYGDKFAEYEKAGVKEYWIFDPLRKTTRFLRLNEEKVYIDIPPDGEGNYRTPLLPGLIVHVPTLWQDPLPNPAQIVDAVRAMLSA